MGVSLEKVGDVRLVAGDRAGALAAYEESLAIRRKLAAADPGNAGWQRDVGVSLNRVGDMRLVAGDVERPRLTRGDFSAFMMSSAERCSAAREGHENSPNPAAKRMPDRPAI